jgi:hypothetical protein
VCLVSEGTWNSAAERIDEEGYTVWGIRDDGTRRVTALDDLRAVLKQILKS